MIVINCNKELEVDLIIIKRQLQNTAAFIFVQNFDATKIT
jgi:hypothetical protein